MLVNEFPPLPTGGAERQAERLATYLAQHGWPVWVITRGAAGLAASEIRSGYQIMRPRPFGPGKMRTITFIIGALLVLWRLRSSYRILHAHLAFGPAFAAVVAGRLLGKLVLVKLGNSGEFGDLKVSQRTLRGRLRLAVFRHWADAVIVLDQAMYDEALAAGFDPRRLHRMNNGIDARSFSPPASRSAAREKLGLADKVLVVYVGRLAAQKALPTLLDGVSYAASHCNMENALHVLLVGDGPERSPLEKQVQVLGLEKQVTFTGNQEDVHPYLEAADMFVLPSGAEGISNALLEAMSSGIACLATPVGDSAEMLDHGQCGVLLPANDAIAWGKALAELGNDAGRREQLGMAARQRILNQYDFSVVGAQYEALYRALAGAAVVAATRKRMV